MLKKITLILVLLACNPFVTQAQLELNIAELLKEEKTAKTAKEKTDVLVDLGIAYFNEGDFKKAQTYFFKGLKYAEKTKNKRKIAGIYNNIASVYNETEQLDKAQYYARLPLNWPELKNEHKTLSDLNNSLALSYYEKYEDSLALIYFKKAISHSEKSGDTMNLALQYRNFAAILCDLKNPEGFHYFRKALSLFNPKKDSIYLYSLHVATAESYNRFGMLDSVEQALKRAEVFLPAVKDNPHRLLDYYYANYDRLAQQGKYKEALEYYIKYRDMDRKVINVDSRKELDEVKTKFQTEKKDLKIKAQKAQLEQTKYRNRLLWILIGILALLSTIVYFWLRSRNQLRFIKLEAENKQIALTKFIEGEENERIRIAKELHDGIVQDLSSIYLNLNAGLHDKEATISHLKQTIKEVRGLSHQMMPITLREKGLFLALEELFSRTLPPLSIDYTFDAFGINERLDLKIETSLYRIVQELLNNIVKHSQASEVNCILRKTEQHILLILEDNGVGISNLENKKGIGLESLSSRLEYLNGTLEMSASENESGLYTKIQIPIVDA